MKIEEFLQSRDFKLDNPVARQWVRERGDVTDVVMINGNLWIHHGKLGTKITVGGSGMEALQRHLEDYDCKRKKLDPADIWTPTEVVGRQIRTLIEAGYTDEEIAEAVSVAHDDITRLRERWGQKKLEEGAYYWVLFETDDPAPTWEVALYEEGLFLRCGRLADSRLVILEIGDKVERESS